MTTSAIQGDRERCLRAGMDEYLTNPVKSKMLEDMLVKWAFEGNRKRRLLDFPETHSSDHDSNCDHPPSGSVSSASGSINSSASRADSNPVVVSSSEPSGSKRGRRGLYHSDSAEQARALGDKKLMAASDSSPDQFHISLPSPRSSSRSWGPLTPLTTENVARHDRERKINPFEFAVGHTVWVEDGNSAAAPSYATSPQLRSVSATESPISPMTIKEERPDWLRVVVGGTLVRNESSSSQVTFYEVQQSGLMREYYWAMLG